MGTAFWLRYVNCSESRCEFVTRKVEKDVPDRGNSQSKCILAQRSLIGLRGDKREAVIGDGSGRKEPQELV